MREAMWVAGPSRLIGCSAPWLRLFRHAYVDHYPIALPDPTNDVFEPGEVG